MRFSPVNYDELDSRQKENYNFQKVSGVLADYGFSTIRLSADWQGADFLAQHEDGVTVLRVQLKGRAVFRKAYMKKDLWICFPKRAGIYLFPHDLILEALLKTNRIMHGTFSWDATGRYSFPKIPKWMLPLLKEYFLPQVIPPTLPPDPKAR